MMNHLILFLLIILGITACDQPVRTRVPTVQDVSGSSAFTQSNMTDDKETEVSSFADLDVEFQHCQLMMQNTVNGGDLGKIGLCQGSYDKLKLLTYFEKSNANGTCFIPISRTNTTDMATGQVVTTTAVLGRAQCVKNTAGSLYKIQFELDRQDQPFNYIVALDYSILDSYFACQNAKEDYFATHKSVIYPHYNCCQKTYKTSFGYRCQNPLINPAQACLIPATNFANQICSFLNNSQSKFVQIQI